MWDKMARVGLLCRTKVLLWDYCVGQKDLYGAIGLVGGKRTCVGQNDLGWTTVWDKRTCMGQKDWYGTKRIVWDKKYGQKD